MTSSHQFEFKPSGFSDVDQSGAATNFVDYLDTAARVGGVAAAKSLSVSLLKLDAGSKVIDLGCGTGDITVRLGEAVGDDGEVIGVDYSDGMVAEARGRLGSETSNVTYEQGDIHNLRFTDGEFDASRAERVLMHLENPDQALQEMVRVTRSGGRVVAVDPDIESVAIDTADLDTGGKIAAILPTYVRHSRMGRSLRRRFVESGLRDVDVSVVPMIYTDYETASTMASFDRLYIRLAEAGLATEHEVSRIRDRFLEADSQGTFAMYGNLFVAVGVVPG